MDDPRPHTRPWHRRMLAALLALALFCLLPSASLAAAGGSEDGNGDGHLSGTFTDIDGHWAAATIQAMLAGGIVSMTPDGKFRPDDAVTRLDFTVWLARALELDGDSSNGGDASATGFSDWDQIPAADQPLVQAAVAAGLVNGYPDHTFRPAATISRVELAVLFGRAFEKLGVDAQARWFKIFADGDTIPAWALPAAATIQEQVIYGRPGLPGQAERFVPFGTATRAEALTMLDRFMQKRNEIAPNLVPKPEPRPLDGGPFLSAYYVNTDYGYGDLLKHGTDMDFVVYTGYSLGADGSLAGYASPRTMQWDADTQQPMLAMFSAGSRSANNALLANPDARHAAVQHMVEVVKQGFVGVNLDMENVDADQRDNYTAFVEEMAAALHPLNKVVTLSVMAKTKDAPTNSLTGVYDYAALGKVADYIMVMTYDYHWAGGSAGPIAPISWVRNVVQYTVSQMPSHKVIVGIPTYAYLWPSNGARAHATAAWDAASIAAAHGVVPTRVGEGEMTFQASMGGLNWTFYYNDTTAILQKIALVGQYHLGGAIMWRLGFEDDASWAPMVNAFKGLR